MDVKYENNKDHEIVKLDGKNLFKLSSSQKVYIKLYTSIITE